jgi:hypothetical protein
VLPVEEGEEVLALLDGGKVGDAGSHEPASATQRRADALVELLRAGCNGDGVAGWERYTLHLVADVDAVADQVGARAELVDGSPIPIETLRRLTCDCGVVRHLLRGGSEPVDIGTRTSVWTTTQRRSIALRDKGRCRFVACERRTCDIHHLHHFADGGRTAIDNRLLLCPRHHTAVRETGFGIDGDPNGALTSHRPDGTILGTTDARGVTAVA